MTCIRRAAVAIGTVALLSLSLAACGDDEGPGTDAPTDASKDEFCDSWDGAFEVLSSVSEEPSEDQWDDFQGKVDQLADVGTPETISDDNRTGFEVFVDVVTETDYDDSGDFGGGLPGASDDEEKKAEGFITYAVTECTDLAELPDGVATE